MNALSDELRIFIIENFLYGQSNGDLSDDSSFLQTGIIDSTGILELINHLERTYGLRMTDAEIVPDNLDSIRKLTRFVEQKIKAGGEVIASAVYGGG
jgi:acyl carrier protein